MYIFLWQKHNEVWSETENVFRVYFSLWIMTEKSSSFVALCHNSASRKINLFIYMTVNPNYLSVIEVVSLGGVNKSAICKKLLAEKLVGTVSLEQSFPDQPCLHSHFSLPGAPTQLKKKTQHTRSRIQKQRNWRLDFPR